MVRGLCDCRVRPFSHRLGPWGRKRAFSVFITPLLHKCGEVECRRQESPGASTLLLLSCFWLDAARVYCQDGTRGPRRPSRRRLRQVLLGSTQGTQRKELRASCTCPFSFSTPETNLLFSAGAAVGRSLRNAGVWGPACPRAWNVSFLFCSCSSTSCTMEPGVP